MGNLWLDPPAGMKPLRMITWPDSNHDIATAFFELGGSDDSPRHLAAVTDDAETAAARTGFLTLFETSGEPHLAAFAKAKMIRWHTPAALADAVTKYLQRELNIYVALTWVRPGQLGTGPVATRGGGQGFHLSDPNQLVVWLFGKPTLTVPKFETVQEAQAWLDAQADNSATQ